MANLNFILKEEDWYESQPIQLSAGKCAISINFGDTANNRVVVYKSSNGKDYVPYKTALSVGEFCDMNIDGLIAGQHIMVGCNELPISSSFMESADGGSGASKSDILAESGRAQLAESQLEQSINAVKTALDELVGTVDATTAIDTFKEIETFLAGVTNEKTLTGMLAVTDGKAVAAQTMADAAKVQLKRLLVKLPAMRQNLTQYLKCRRMMVRYMVFATVHGWLLRKLVKIYILIDYEMEDRCRSNLGVTPCSNPFDVPVVAGRKKGKFSAFKQYEKSLYWT